MDICHLMITALLRILSCNFNLYVNNSYTIFKHLYYTNISVNQNLKKDIVILNGI